jgi:hypothetical protein
MQDEFYTITFRKKLYKYLESLHADLNEWMKHYIEERPHSDRYYFGKTPLQTFNESLTLTRKNFWIR